MFKPTGTFYKMSIKDYTVYLTEEEARKVEQQYASGHQILSFMDLLGSRTVIPHDAWQGHWESTTEIRTANAEQDVFLKEEEKSYSKSWDE